MSSEQPRFDTAGFRWNSDMMAYGGIGVYGQQRLISPDTDRKVVTVVDEFPQDESSKFGFRRIITGNFLGGSITRASLQTQQIYASISDDHHQIDFAYSSTDDNVSLTLTGKTTETETPTHAYFDKEDGHLVDLQIPSSATSDDRIQIAAKIPSKLDVKTLSEDLGNPDADPRERLQDFSTLL